MLRECASPRVEVVPVHSRAEDRAFSDFPYRLYRDDPFWVPPLRREERRRWSARHNASLRSRWVRRFLALRQDRVVGRVAAIIDGAFAARWEPSTALFGFFECADDPEAARALLDAAERALSDQGMRRVIGPVSLTTHDETGILVDGFDSSPMVLSPYNPPYYVQLLEEAGYRPYLDYHSYLGSPNVDPQRVVERLARSATCGEGTARGISVRPLNLRRWDSEVRILYELYNVSFANVWGVVPISWDEFLERANRFRPILVPELVLFAEVSGEPVGLAMTLPDINEALSDLGGRLWPFGWLRLARRLPRIRSARFVVLGVLPEYTGRGVGTLLASETAAAFRRLGIRRVELSLVQETNEPVRRVIEAFGSPILKTFRLYAKTLPTPAGAEYQKAEISSWRGW